MARKGHPCNMCGTIGWAVKASLPAGEYRCQPCRRIAPQPSGRRVEAPAPRVATCAHCGETFTPIRGGGGWTRHCSRLCAAARTAGRPAGNHPPTKCVECGVNFVSRKRTQQCCSQSCAQRRRMRINPPPNFAGNTGSSRAIPTEWTQRTRRRYRERVTPGLTIRELRALRDKWHGTPCAYCGDAATTIDHVLPISRGGTNYEGNLVPCCKPCNSSKCALLLAEWKHGKPNAGTVTDRPWMHEAPIWIAA